jgi:hypothetical protein
VRDYLSSAMRFANKVVPRSAALRTFVSRHRTFVFGLFAAYILTVTMCIVAVRGMMYAGAMTNSGATQNSQVPGSSITTTMTNDGTDQVNDNGAGGNVNANQSHTKVTVNGQPVAVPQNGTTSQTVTNENGTAHVTISHNTESSGNTTSQNISSTHLNVTTNSQDANMTSP